MKQTLKRGPTPTEWNPDALWAKSLRYAATMLRRKDIEWEWEYAFWSSLLLEHLARTALTNVHPILVAQGGRNQFSSLLYAIGLPNKTSNFSPKSIAILDIFDRLQLLFEDFTLEDVKFCKKHMNRRNSEVHTGTPSFDGLAVNSWEAPFYKACKILLGTMNLGLDDLFGQEEAMVAEKLICADSNKNSSAIKNDLKIHENLWLAKPDDEKQKLSQRAALWATEDKGHRVDCPACGSISLVFGEPVGEIKKTLEDDMIIERQDILPSAFKCIACNLKIDGFSLLVAVGLGNRFINTSTYPPMDYYAMEDSNWYYYESDNNEPFDF